jgi:uncharacterized protein (TIGR02466 family)
MQHDLWFPSPISSDIIEGLNNSVIADFCLTMKETNTGRLISNYGGWQSNNLDLNTPELFELFSEIRAKLHILKTDIGMHDNVTLDIDNIWINVNQKTNYNSSHVHPRSAFSGTYYVKCNSETSGNISFRSPVTAHEYHLDSHWFKENNMLIAHTECFYYPANGLIVLFPSWLSHHVTPNTGDDERISISFNTKIKRL